MTDTTPSSVADRADRFRRPDRDWNRVAVWAIVGGAVLRIVWQLVVHPPVAYIYSDMAGYVVRAAQLAAGAPSTPDDAFFPPGTHMLLSIPIGLFGVPAGLWVAAVMWCLLSIATVYMAWRLTRELLTPAAAAITAILCAGWPLFITYGGFFTSETPAVAFLVAALWAGVVATGREGGQRMALALLAGLLGGVAAAVRPQLVINLVILAVLVVVASRRRLAPVAWFAGGLVAVLALVVVYNSVASGQVTGLARNGGLNFWFGHCNARSVTTLDADNTKTGEIRHPVPGQAGRPGDYVVKSHDVWDDGFFLGLGMTCIQQDGLGHVVRLGRNVLDMTATTMPWPQDEGQGWPRSVVQVSNVLYSVLLPWIVIESVGLARRRGRGARRGEVFVLWNLACAAVVAIVVIGDPRVRSDYDVFGFALLAALLSDRFHLDGAPEPAEVDAG